MGRLWSLPPAWTKEIMPLTTTTAPEIAKPTGVAEFVVLCSPQDSRPAGWATRSFGSWAGLVRDEAVAA